MILAASADSWEILSLVASVVAIALAAFAIWQASTFYRWSNQASKDARHSADAVGESVRKLEELFHRLYSDTFGMMRDTVSDMRKHMWPSADDQDGPVVEEVEKRANENVAKVRDEVMNELRGLVEQVGATATQVSDLEGSLNGVLDRAISGSREATEEAIQEIVRGHLMTAVNRFRQEGRSHVMADELLGPLFGEFEAENVHEALLSLREKGIVDWDGEGWIDGPEVQVDLGLVSSRAGGLRPRKSRSGRPRPGGGSPTGP
jgi:hypothetical protein